MLALVGVASAQEDYLFVTKWGSYGSGDGQFSVPAGVAVDTLGDVYVADFSNHRIQKFTSTGTFITKWGSSGSGDGQFRYPRDVAVDASGNVYVAEYDNFRIQKFTSTGAFLTNWGSFGTGDGEFQGIYGMAVEEPGYVYVVDSGSDRIQKFTATGTYLIEWGSEGPRSGEFRDPFGVAVDGSGNVYVSDFGNSRVQKFTRTGGLLTRWGSPGSGDGQFSAPRHVAVDASGDVYVADFSNHRIQKFTPHGTFLTTWGSEGSGDGQFNGAIGVAVDAAGNVYVAEQNSHRIQKFAPRPKLEWVGTTGYEFDGVDPDSGKPLGDPAETAFTFRVKYTNITGSAPTMKKCVVRRRTDAMGWQVYRSRGMAVESGTPDTGQVLKASLKLPAGVWQYRCQFSAAIGQPTGDPTTWQDGPTVDCPPMLSWANKTGFDGADGVHPNSAAAGSRFYFRVVYRSSAGTEPTVAQCELRRDGRTVKTLDMTACGSVNQAKLRLGVPYTCRRRLKRADDYEYRLHFSDGTNWAVGDPAGWTAGLSVTSGTGALGITSLSAVPTSAGAQLTFSLSSSAQVRARVLNIAGRPVKTLCTARDSEAGSNTLLWNAMSDQGLAVPGGTYLVEVAASAPDGSQTRALTQLRVER